MHERTKERKGHGPNEKVTLEEKEWMEGWMEPKTEGYKRIRIKNGGMGRNTKRPKKKKGGKYQFSPSSTTLS